MYEDSVKYLIEKEKSCSTLHSKTRDYFNALINYSPSPDADKKLRTMILDLNNCNPK